MRAGVQFGTSWGIAVSWFLGTVVEAIVAGVLVGAIVKDGGRN